MARCLSSGISKGYARYVHYISRVCKSGHSVVQTVFPKAMNSVLALAQPATMAVRHGPDSASPLLYHGRSIRDDTESPS